MNNKKLFLDKNSKTYSNTKKIVNLIGADNSIAILITIINLVISLTVLILRFNQLPPLIPFLYSNPWGEKMLVSTRTMLIIIGIIWLLFFIETIICLKFIKSSQFLIKITTFSSAIATSLLSLSIIKIIFLVS